ncbi:hypothetical protein, partial [Vibrio sp. F74]|uniref:hypothetical protein n=1 Tax=Vibrio sp. F74 TaxID=700020 RepID=UPI0035F5EEFF
LATATDSNVTFTETQGVQTITGGDLTVAVVQGSDDVESVTFNIAVENNVAWNSLTSNNEQTSVKVSDDGKTVLVYTGNDSND